MLDGGNDKISLGGGNDLIYATNQYHYAAKGLATVDGGSGSDYLFLTRDGSDLFSKGQTVDLSGTTTFNGGKVKFTNVENVYASYKADQITGNSVANTLYGLGGNDKLTGGLGADRLNGGAGKDTFIYTSAKDSFGNKHDTLLDFKHGQDVLDLSRLHPDTKDDKFDFIGDHKFTKHAGELHFIRHDVAGTANDYTMVEADLDGNGKADLQIELSGLINLGKGDFLL
jgi:Ca2+-binding RTX toxin-like protein